MLDNVITAILFLIFLYVTKNSIKSLFFYIPLSFLYDLIAGSLEQGSISSIVRGLLTSFLVLIILVKHRNFRSSKQVLVIVSIYLFHLAIMCFLSINPIKSFSEYIKTFNILLIFFVGYNLSSNGLDIVRLLKSTKWVLLITLVNQIIANYIGFGFSGYNESGFFSGNIFANNWYPPALSVIIQSILIFGISQAKNNYTTSAFNRYFWLIIIFLSLLIIILSGRRSAVLILTVGIFFYLIFNPNRIKSIVQGMLFAIIMIITLPYYQSVLLQQYENRLTVLELEEEGYEDEYRYKETELLWDELLSFDDMKRSLFGRDPFLTPGNYGGGQLGNRYLHVDLNIVAFNSGLVGLVEYILIYFFIFFLYIKDSKKQMNRYSTFNPYYKLIFLSIFFSSFLLSFSGGYNALTFRSMSFLLMGAILGHIYYTKKKPISNKNVYTKKNYLLDSPAKFKFQESI